MVCISSERLYLKFSRANWGLSLAISRNVGYCFGPLSMSSNLLSSSLIASFVFPSVSQVILSQAGAGLAVVKSVVAIVVTRALWSEPVCAMFVFQCLMWFPKGLLVKV